MAVGGFSSRFSSYTHNPQRTHEHTLFSDLAGAVLCGPDRVGTRTNETQILSRINFLSESGKKPK